MAYKKVLKNVETFSLHMIPFVIGIGKNGQFLRISFANWLEVPERPNENSSLFLQHSVMVRSFPIYFEGRQCVDVFFMSVKLNFF